MKVGIGNAEVGTGGKSTADLKVRTQQFALEVIRFVEQLPRGRTTEILGRQLLRSATSVGANYRAARRARSTAEFIAKLGIVEEEADETIYWLELLQGSGNVTPREAAPLRDEAGQLLAIIVTSIRTARNAKRK